MVRLNNFGGAQSSSTTMWISKLDDNSDDITEFINTLRARKSDIKGFVRIARK